MCFVYSLKQDKHRTHQAAWCITTDALIMCMRSQFVTDTIARYDYGSFVHIMDCEGNKVELWEPNDVAYEKMGIEMGAATTK